MEEQSIQKPTQGSNALLPVIAVLALAVIIGAIAFLQSSEAKPQANVSDAQARQQQVAARPVVQTSESTGTETYTNGEYVATGEYVTPGGQEKIGVTLTIASGLVTSAEVEQMAVAPISQKLQGVFADNFKTMVVGKSLVDLKLDKVSSSSLTPKGFNDALEKIKAQAKG